MLLEYYLNGYFINHNELSQEFKDLLSACLHIDPNKRKNISYLINHPVFDEVRGEINYNDRYYLIPIEKDYIKTIYTDELKYGIATGSDNYEIFRNILKIDLINFLKKKGLIEYKPKILNIPQYFSLYSAETEDYLMDEEEDISSIKVKVPKPVENIYVKEFNDNKFNEGCLIAMGSYVIKMPTDYEKDNVTLDNFLKNNIYDIQLFKSEGLISEKSSNSDHSKVSRKDSQSVKGELIKSASKLGSQTLDKEISNYFRIKFLLYNTIFHTGICKRDDLIVELKKNNYFIPSNLRSTVYLIILDIDYINDLEEFEIGTIYENRDYVQQEINQIKKDLLRCEEYDKLFKTNEGKYHLSVIFEALLYNKSDFFYNQGMDSILAALVKLYYTRNEFTYEVFYKFVKKLLYCFYDIQNKTINNLSFQHLIISRILAFIDPELYIYLDKIGFFETQYATNWILTMFSSIQY